MHEGSGNEFNVIYLLSLGWRILVNLWLWCSHMELQYPHLFIVKLMLLWVLDTLDKAMHCKLCVSVWSVLNNSIFVNAEAGNAVLSVLTGDFNPAGRLVVTWYTGDDQLPPMVSYSMVNRTYRYMMDTPQYHFGYGLSYTNFSYSALTVWNPLFYHWYCYLVYLTADSAYHNYTLSGHQCSSQCCQYWKHHWQWSGAILLDI